MWIIAALPTLIIVLAVVVEVGNLWLARVELENALEAGALAAVKVWQDGGSRADARTAAKNLTEANTIRGKTITISRNEDLGNTSGNENAACSGWNIVILGGMDPGDSSTFNGSANVGCDRNYNFSLDVTVHTTDTFQDDSSFDIDYDSGTLSISSIKFDLQHGGDNGVFQVNSGTVDVNTPSGYGDEDGYGLLIAPAPNITNDPTSGATIVELGSLSDGDTTPTLTFNFPPGEFVAGESLVFGVDTDFVGPDTDEEDNAGEFIVSTFLITVTFNTGDTAEILGSDLTGGGGNAGLTGHADDFSIDDADYAVRVKGTTTVDSVLGSVFGFTAGSYSISATADATFRCSGTEPQLVIVNTYSCPGTPPP